MINRVPYLAHDFFQGMGSACTKAECMILGTAAKIFTIAGAVMVYGVKSSRNAVVFLWEAKICDLYTIREGTEGDFSSVSALAVWGGRGYNVRNEYYG